MMMNLLRRKCWGHKIFHPNAFSKETARNNHPREDKVKRKRVLGYQGPDVSRVKVVLGSQEMLWDLKKCFEISKNALRSQKML